MAANGVLKKKLAAIAEGVAAERDWWEAKRESTKEEFMRELDQDAAGAAAAAVEKKTQGLGLGQTGGPVVTQGAPAVQAEKMVKGLSSDGSDEAVLVETPGQASATAAGGGGGGSGGGGGKNKKKKGKR